MIIIINTQLLIHLTVVNSSACTGATVSAYLFAIVFAVCVAVFTTVIVIICIKSKTKLHGVDNELSHGTATTLSTYDYITHQQSPQAAIDTRKNIAYVASH